jgi:hypothetical protein
MKFETHKDSLGEPALKIAGLQIWIHGREFPAATEHFDADWLRITAHCGSAGASVWVHGALLSSWSFAQFAAECGQLYQTLTGRAHLGSYEPNLGAEFRAADGAGHLEFAVEITPDHLEQQHRFVFGGFDQSYLPSVIVACNAIVARHPTAFAVRDHEQPGTSVTL